MSAKACSTDLAVRVINDEAGFLALEPAWERLATIVPFRSFSWHHTWWKHFGAGHSLTILAVYEQDTCIGLAPFFVQRILAAGRVAQFIGSGEVASDQQSILAAPGRDSEVGDCIARWFNSEQNKFADLMQLDGADVRCPVMASFIESAQEIGYTQVDTSTIHTWRIELPKTMDDYLAMLSKSCRRKVRTAMKRFDSGELSVSISADSADFDRNWDHFVDLHQRRRLSLGEAGCFADQAFAGFLRDIAKQFFDTGQLDLVCVSSLSGPVATEICFRDESCSYAYQIGINPDSLKDNPGWLVNTASIRHAIASGLSHFDFCRGDFDYKRQLGAEPAVCRRLRLTPPRWRSQALNVAITSGTAMKNWCQNTFIPSTSKS